MEEQRIRVQTSLWDVLELYAGIAAVRRLMGESSQTADAFNMSQTLSAKRPYATSVETVYSPDLDQSRTARTTSR